MKFNRLQGLRFVAATAVVAYHARSTALTYGVADSAPLAVLRFAGWGVDLFFIISGFIICYAASQRESDWRVFATRRLARIVPLYWLATLVFCGLRLLPGITRGASGIGAVDLVRSLTFTSWTAGANSFPLLYVGWSLEYEMLFYLIATVAIARAPAPWTTVSLGLALLAGGGALAGIVVPDKALHFLVNPMLLEFLFGVLIAEFTANRRRPWIALLAVTVALGLISPSGWGMRVWLAGVPSALLVLWAVRRDAAVPGTGRLLRLAAELGDASYSTYLTHLFVVSATCKLLLRIWPASPMIVAVLLIVLVSLVVGHLVFRLVERPLARLTRRVMPSYSVAGVAGSRADRPTA